MKQENNNSKLWIPTTSDFYIDSQWLEANFPPEVRFNNVILVGDNILNPEMIRLIYYMHKDIANITLRNGDKWDDVCKK